MKIRTTVALLIVQATVKCEELKVILDQACIQQRRIQDHGQTECCVPSETESGNDLKDPNLSALVYTTH